MARAQYQVLVIPHRNTGAATEFAVLRRSDSSHWQFISGGGEDGEDPLSSAKREATEEAGITEGVWLRLDSVASIPRSHFPSATHWPSSIFVVPEYSFAVSFLSSELILSTEHVEMRWLNEADANSLLTFDSNRVALWELIQRLRQNQK